MYDGMSFEFPFVGIPLVQAKIRTGIGGKTDEIRSGKSLWNKRSFDAKEPGFLNEWDVDQRRGKNISAEIRTVQDVR